MSVWVFILQYMAVWCIMHMPDWFLTHGLGLVPTAGEYPPPLPLVWGIVGQLCGKIWVGYIDMWTREICIRPPPLF